MSTPEIDNIAGKIISAIEKPELIVPYLYTTMADDVVDPARIRYLKWRTDGWYTVALDGYTLAVDLDDSGLGRELALNGVREPISSAAYRRELDRLSGQVDDPVVAEIGANIGYYALMPTVDLPDATVYAAEVVPENAELLQHNIDRNGVAGQVTVDCVAIGEESGEGDLHVSSHSNWHSLQDTFATDMPDRVDETQTTAVQRGTAWLAKNDLGPSDVHVLRMDVEGYEASVLRGLPGLFDGAPMVVHMEVHPKLMDDDDIEYLRGRLDDIEIVAAARGGQELPVPASIGELLSYPWAEFVGRVPSRA